jgi:predicted acylesterase/phospholipase RssA
VQYIGAYKAIKKNKPNTKITSIIGSSAGSILGLAIGL